jgi:hypothetical protein
MSEMKEAVGAAMETLARATKRHRGNQRGSPTAEDDRKAWEAAMHTKTTAVEKRDAQRAEEHTRRRTLGIGWKAPGPQDTGETSRVPPWALNSVQTPAPTLSRWDTVPWAWFRRIAAKRDGSHRVLTVDVEPEDTGRDVKARIRGMYQWYDAERMPLRLADRRMIQDDASFEALGVTQRSALVVRFTKEHFDHMEKGEGQLKYEP